MAIYKRELAGEEQIVITSDAEDTERTNLKRLLKLLLLRGLTGKVNINI
jgi:hypothetical protein